MVPEDSVGFAINLQRGSDPEHADVHLQLRAQLGRSPILVWNSRLQSAWGVEEQLPGPFPIPLSPRPFLLVITSYLDTFEVEVIGSSSNFSIKVRDGLPISSITHMAIQAQLAVWAIHATVENMPRQLRLSLGKGANVGDLVFIRGQPTQEAKSFIVNWQNGPAKYDDVLFQLDSKLDEKTVVRNSRQDEVMGKAESSKECPFQSETPFTLAMGVTPLGFETRLDGKEWHSFQHRLDMASARTLLLDGDMQPLDILIDSAQMNPPTTLNGSNWKSRGIRLQLICPELPLNSRVTGGFEKGCLLLITGKVNTQPTKMHLAVLCGEGLEDSDTALDYVVQWDDSASPKATLNSKEEAWGTEVKKQIEDGFYPECSFDLLIARTGEGFRCYLNGIEHASLPYRLDEDNRPDHITLCGDVQVARLLLL